MDVAIEQVGELRVWELQHELRKRGLLVSGIKKDLRERVVEALRSEHADGWTQGYLLNTKTISFNGRGRDPRTLVGRSVTGLGVGQDNTMVIGFADGEEAVVVCQASDADDLIFFYNEELFDIFNTSSNQPRTYEKKPLLITEAATALRKNYQGVVAATVLGIKLAGMKKMAFIGIADCDECDNIHDVESCNHTSWSKLGVNVWLAGDGEAGLEGDFSMSKNMDFGQGDTTSLNTRVDTPIKSEGSTDDIDHGGTFRRDSENLVSEEEGEE